MDTKTNERGILKLEPRSKGTSDVSYKYELTPQGSGEHGPSSPQPSVDRLSVTWAEPGSMTSSGVNLFHLPSDTPVSNEVKFSPTVGDGSEDEDYSASLSAVLRQRQESVRRSRKGRGRRPSSPFLPDDNQPRRRSSVFTTSSGDTAISMEETPAPIVNQEQIFENIRLHKEVLVSVKQQPLGMRRKLKIVHQAKAYIKRHEGQLQERLAQSKSTKDIYARFNILIAAKLQQLKREAANMSNFLIPWEARIKEIESHFGSVVASYFTFLRWLFWVNLVIGFILLVFVIVPEYLTSDPKEDGERKTIMKDELVNATNLLTLWEFEGVLKYSPIFYGYYSNIERAQYRMPLAYFLTGLVVYIYSFVAILRKMAENSRMSKLSEKEDECIFSWKLFTGWDFMIGNAETAHNRIASVTLGFKEALLEEAEKKKDLRNWRIISFRALVNICVIILLAASACAVVFVVRTDSNLKYRSWWRENATTIVVTMISITFPVAFELLGLLEHYHPRKQLRLQLARIMALNLLNLYSLIFALFSKIEGMSKDLDLLKPNITMNATMSSDSTLNISEALVKTIPLICIENIVPCGSCFLQTTQPTVSSIDVISKNNRKKNTKMQFPLNKNIEADHNHLYAENLIQYGAYPGPTYQNPTTISDGEKELQRLRNIAQYNIHNMSQINDTSFETDDNDYNFYDFNTTLGNGITGNTLNFKPTDANSNTDFSENDGSNPSTVNVKMHSTTSEITSSYTTESNNEITNENSLIPSNTESIDSSTNFKLYVSQTATEQGYSREIFQQTTDIKNVPVYVDFSTTYQSTTYNAIDLSNSDYFTTETSTPYSTTRNLNIETESTIKHLPETTTHSVTGHDLYTSKDSFNETIGSSEKIICLDLSSDCSASCEGKNITQKLTVSNCNKIERICYETVCNVPAEYMTNNHTDLTSVDTLYIDDNNIKQYNLTIPTRKKLLKLCWETMFGQELVKLTMMDLVFVLLGTLFMDFFRALLVRYMNRCWCWDLEKKFPQYGDFKIAENILHLINNQGMVWMGMFFSPGLVILNVVKLVIMMYLRSWAVMTCNVPHEVVFRVSKSNNFYLALLLTMLFLCVLPVGYTIVWVKPSWHCGPFSEYDKIYYILTNNIYKILPESLNFILKFIASPAIVIPFLVLLILIIYYLTSLTNSLREANNDLKIQLRRERTEERRKMFKLADTRRRAGSSAMDNTPFARWKRALPSLPLSKSIDSDDRKTLTGDETVEPLKSNKKKGNIFAKIVNLAIDKKSDASATSNAPSPVFYNDDETDTDFHENLPKEILKAKDITFLKRSDRNKKNIVEFMTHNVDNKSEQTLNVAPASIDDRSEKKAVVEKQFKEIGKILKNEEIKQGQHISKKIIKKLTSESSTQSKQSDSIGSVIPVIMISTTESDEEILHDLQNNKGKKDTKSKEKKHKEYIKGSRAHDDYDKKVKKSSSDSKPLRRQSSVDSTDAQKSIKEIKPEDGHKYQYSL